MVSSVKTYFISTLNGDQREVTKKEYIEFERSNGFYPKSDNPEKTATTSFTGEKGSGVWMYSAVDSGEVLRSKYAKVVNPDNFIPFNLHGELGTNSFASKFVCGLYPYYPNFGEGLRWKNRDSEDYTLIEIHIDDLVEFHLRVNTFKNE